jgi:two-component system sensor histidine kinase RegB
MIKNLKLLVLLRWGAIAFQVLALVGAIAFQLPVHMNLFLFAIGVQCVVNLMTFASLGRREGYSEWSVFFQLVFDVIALNVFMVASGGLANPFSGFFLIQAVLAAVLLSQVRMWVIVAATGVSYAVLTLGFEPAHMHHGPLMAFHMYGMVVNHVFTTLLIGYFIFKIVSNLKAKEKQLSARQGLIGAGATAAQIAHKLGTPLNIMALIAEGLSSQALAEDKVQLLQEIERCKSYLNVFFQRLHYLEADSDRQPLSTVFSKFAIWIKRYPDLSFDYDTKDDQIVTAMAADLMTLLLEILAENAAEANATHFQLKALVSGSLLTLDVQNNGPPFPDDLQALMTLGYSKDKGLNHTGIGLFLARLVLDNMGADVRVGDPHVASLKIIFPLDVVTGL